MMNSYYASILILVIFLICVGNVHVHAQTYTTQGDFTLFGSTNNEKKFYHCLDGSGSGSIFVTGATDGTALGQSGGSWDWFVLKYNRNNGFLTTNPNNPTIRWLSTPSEEVGLGCASDVNGAVYVTGYTYGILNTSDTITATGRDVVVAKYDSNMNQVWIRQFDMIPNTASHSSYPVGIAIYGSYIYVAGYAENQVFIALLDSNSGDVIRSRSIPPANGGGVYPFVLTVDVDGVAILGGSLSSAYFAGEINSRGETVPETAPENSYINSFAIAFYPDDLGRKFQFSIPANQYNEPASLTTDSDRNLYISGMTRSSINDADYLPINSGGTLPFFSKYSSAGEHIWTSIYPQSDNQMFRQIVVDNIGGVYLLRTRYDCQYPFPLSISPSDVGWGCTATDTEYIYLLKADINGAIQWDTRVSTGIPLTTTLDNTGMLTIGGSIGGSNSLHGTSGSGYDGFIDQISINYNCSCGNLAQLVQEMTELLNIVPE